LLINDAKLQQELTLKRHEMAKKKVAIWQQKKGYSILKATDRKSSVICFSLATVSIYIFI